MIRSAKLIAIAATAVLAACAVVVDETSRQAVYWARYDWLPNPTNMLWGHCTRTEAERCTVSLSDPQLYQCTYREYSTNRPWPLKRATIRRDGEDWRWVDGDPPSCSIAIVEE
ncbi:MAG: hypothetical protein JNM59_05555 [Hyphomonadaceae bacterium]|nr:hypothetical protein [Hyphomonadaceae bacterium]